MSELEALEPSGLALDGRAADVTSPRPPGADGVTRATADAPVQTPWRRFVRRFRRERVALLAGVVLLFLVVGALLAPVVAPHDPDAIDLRGKLQDPLSPGHLLGTDHLGRDVLSRLLYGARVSLLAVCQAVGVGALLGIVPGLVAGYTGGWADRGLTLLTDALQSFPPLILALVILAALGPGLTNAMLAVGVLFAPRFIRIARSCAMSVREETFVEAARSMGLSRWHIVTRHVLPHVLSPLIVATTFLASAAMLAEAGLSFLGLGVQPPQSSWGSMLSAAFRFIPTQPWLAVWPGVAVVVTVLCLNLLGDGIRDSLGRETRRVLA